MGVICATLRRAKRAHVCANCGRTITRHTKYVRAYGNAHRGERPYAVAIHRECAGTDALEKLKGSPHA